ncbi:MAG: FtsX-like permease family protein, partial [Candidatus Sumerlaeia bacterium]|nr:FtsX-like permease family protein [Candidatus Sumerlaeia bacterium]
VGTIEVVVENSTLPPRSIQVLGVDVLATGNTSSESGIRSLGLEFLEGAEFTDLLTQQGAILISEKLAERLGFEDSDELKTADGESLRVVGVLQSEDMNQINNGDVIVADLSVADLLLGTEGELTQIDVLPVEGVELAVVKQELESLLPPTVLVDSPANRGERVNKMIEALRFNLMSLGHISLLVGAFLIYNTMSISVLRRKTLIGTLRAMGIPRGIIRICFVMEGILFGVLGGLLGLLLGTLMALGLLGVVSDTISISFFETKGERLDLSLASYATAFALGILFSTLAALHPAQIAASTPPANTLVEGHGASSPLLQWFLVIVGIVAAIFGLCILQLPLNPGIPWVGYLASVCFITALICFVQPLLKLFLNVLHPLLSKILKAEGLLATAGIQGTLGRSSVAVAGLMISVGMCVAVSIMVSSFRQTVIVWMNQVLQADVYMIAADHQQGIQIPRWMEKKILQIDGIERIDALQSQGFLYNDFPARISGIDFNTERWTTTLKVPVPVERLQAAVEAEEVLVSEAFSRRHGLSVGDTVELPHADGLQQCTIAGIYTDYSSPQGFILIGRGHYERLYGEQDFESFSLHLREGTDIETIRESILQLVSKHPELPKLNVNLSSQLREFALEQFDRTFAVTSALQIIAVVVAILGIVTTLLAQLFDRKRELQTLRTIGASAFRVSKMVVVESGIIALVGILMGLIVGVILSWILTTVVMLQSFGWTINFRVSPFEMVEIAILIFVAVLLGSIYPARKAAQMEVLS